ncbi:hypothetical protein KSF_093900 [Reticulibacter mediterranei]|uniref:Uncharacterized protein n=1 Tax=Reticulibacter mediterranei TaxID=2778369 RepID=A0A8J3IYZ2_9CHLR|nr:hypothetical protein KSF_093900 [Reticulibacter mediterranei]
MAATSIVSGSHCAQEKKNEALVPLAGKQQRRIAAFFLGRGKYIHPSDEINIVYGHFLFTG